MIPAILAVLLLSKVEHRLKQWIPEVAALVFVPCLSLLICGFVVFTVIGPLADYVGVGIASGCWLYQLSPMISGALLAGIGQLFVVFGVHWGIIPLALINIQVQGYDTIMAMFMSAVMGQFGAVTGAIFIARSLRDRQIAISASLSRSLASPNRRCTASISSTACCLSSAASARRSAVASPGCCR